MRSDRCRARGTSGSLGWRLVGGRGRRFVLDDVSPVTLADLGDLVLCPLGDLPDALVRVRVDGGDLGINVQESTPDVLLEVHQFVFGTQKLASLARGAAQRHRRVAERAQHRGLR
jgi:hypothetical protein